MAFKNNLMYRILTLLFLFFTIHSQAQFGFKAVNTWPKKRIAETNTNNMLFPTLIGGGIDYWFRLKKYRLEFLPAVHAQYAHETITLDVNTSGELSWLTIEFIPTLQFYPLDFNNDCNCPTFSKQGQFLKKGFFLSIAPGVAYSMLRGKKTQVTVINEFIGLIRAGAGLDIGVSDLLTLSPSIQYQKAQPLDWRNLFVNPGSAKQDVYSGLFLNVRLGWRLDKKNY